MISLFYVILAFTDGVLVVSGIASGHWWITLGGAIAYLFLVCSAIGEGRDR